MVLYVSGTVKSVVMRARSSKHRPFFPLLKNKLGLSGFQCKENGVCGIKLSLFFLSTEKSHLQQINNDK